MAIKGYHRLYFILKGKGQARDSTCNYYDITKSCTFKLPPLEKKKTSMSNQELATEIPLGEKQDQSSGKLCPHKTTVSFCVYSQRAKPSILVAQDVRLCFPNKTPLLL